MKIPRKNNGFSRVRAFDAIWKSCQSIELATAKMCATKGSIYPALSNDILIDLESFVRPLGSIWGTLGRPLGGHLELWRDPRALIFACQELSYALQGCQERPRRLQERPRKLLERPRGLREVSKRSPKGSKRPPRGSKRPPRGLQGASKGSPVSPRGVQVAFWMFRVHLVSQYAFSCDPKRLENSNSCSKDAAGIISGVSI